MSGGPISPTSLYFSDTSGRVYPLFYAGGGGNAAPTDEGIGIQASLSADVVVQMRFPVPPSVPSGTLKLRILGLCSYNSTNQNAKFTVADGTCSAGASPSATTLTTENSGTAYTQAFGATAGSGSSTSQDKYMETKVSLSASPVANDMLVVALTFKTSSWTLATESCWIVTVIWE